MIRLLLIIAVPLPLLLGQTQSYHGNLYGGKGKTTGSSCIVLDNGSYAVVGTASNQGFGADDILLIRLDPFLQTQWSKLYGGRASDRATSIVQNGSKGFLLLGTSESYGAGGQDVLVVSVDTEGNPLWAKIYGGARDDRGYCIRAVREGGFLIAGTTRSFGNRSWAAFLLRIDEQGNILWFLLYDNINTDVAADFEQTSDGGFLVTGWTYAIGAGLHDVLVFKTHSDGSLRWARIFGGLGDDGGHTVHEIPGDGYVVVGNTHSFGHGDVDAFLIRIAEEGRPLWMYAIGREGEDMFRQSYRGGDSTISLAGWLTANGGQQEPWIATISNSGNLLYSGSIRNTVSGQALSLTAGRAGSVLLIGEYQTAPHPSLFVSEARIPPGHTPITADMLAVSAFDATITMAARTDRCPSMAVPIKSMTFSPRVSADDAHLQSVVSREEAAPRNVPTLETVAGDTTEFVLSRIGELAEARKILAMKIPCDFSQVDKELERTEAILRIGDFERSLANLWRAESLFRGTPCGAVTVEELDALGSLYEGRIIEMTASVVRRGPSIGGNGYFLTLRDKTGEIDAFYEGTLRDVMEGDHVWIEGSYSHDKARISVRNISKVGSPSSMGVFAAIVATVAALAVIVFRLLRRRSLNRNASSELH